MVVDLAVVVADFSLYLVWVSLSLILVVVDDGGGGNFYFLFFG